MPDVRFDTGAQRNEHGNLMGLRVATRYRAISVSCPGFEIAPAVLTFEEAKTLRSFLDAAIAHVEKLNRKPKARGTA